MSSAVTETKVMVPPALQEKVLLGGDLSKLTPAERLSYYSAVCESVGLNPLTRPFEYIMLNGRLTLYARKDCTDQLRTKRHISITKLERETTEGIYVVTAYACEDDTTRTDSSIGAVPIANLQGEAKANAMMKAETKAKRRVTLSICGLGMLDETEVESIPDAKPYKPVRLPSEILADSERPAPSPEPLDRVEEHNRAMANVYQTPPRELSADDVVAAVSTPISVQEYITKLKLSESVRELSEVRNAFEADESLSVPDRQLLRTTGNTRMKELQKK